MRGRRSSAAKMYPELFQGLYGEGLQELASTSDKVQRSCLSTGEPLSPVLSRNKRMTVHVANPDFFEPKMQRDQKRASVLAPASSCGDLNSPKITRDRRRCSTLNMTASASVLQRPGTSGTVTSGNCFPPLATSSSSPELQPHRRSSRKSMTMPAGQLRPSSRQSTVVTDQFPMEVSLAGSKQSVPEKARSQASIESESASKSTSGKGMTDLVWVARGNGVPLDTCRQASELFLQQVPSLTKSLNVKEFGNILLLVTGKSSLDELPEGFLEMAFKIADKDKGGDINFFEFVGWFATVGFNTNITLSEKERDFREFCEKHRMGFAEVDTYKKYFQEFADEDDEVGKPEFEKLVKKCAKVPKDVEIPAPRMKQLWIEADIDGSGAIDFEEFAIFYKKHFEGHSGFFDFYQKVRPALGAMK